MELALLVLCAALQVADALTTLRVLALGGREGNPVVAWAMVRIGVVPALVAYKALVCAASVLAYLYAPWWVLAGLCAVYVGVVGWNVKLTLKTTA